MGSAIWALLIADSDKSYDINDFFKYIKMIVMEGGDADTNATVAGAILGAYYHRMNRSNNDRNILFNHKMFKVPIKLYRAYFDESSKMIDLISRSIKS